MDSELKTKVNRLDISMRIGKNGLTNSVIIALSEQLKKNKLVKVKLLKSCVEDNDKKEIAAKLAKKTESKIVSMIGFVIVLWKR